MHDHVLFRAMLISFLRGYERSVKEKESLFRYVLFGKGDHRFRRFGPIIICSAQIKLSSRYKISLNEVLL